METLEDLETKLKELSQSHNVSCFQLGIKTYQVSQLEEDISKTKIDIYNKNIDADALVKKIKKLKEAAATPEVTL